MVRCSIFTAALGLVGMATAAPVPEQRALSKAEQRALTTVRVMPFGASIVEITCWRGYLYQKLQQAGIGNIDFVGSHKTPSGACTLNGNTVPFDKDNEGHSGARVTDYANNGSLKPWLSSANPDIIVMHVGTNDATAGIATAQVFAAYDTLLAQMRANNPKVTLIVSKLIPVAPKLFGQAATDRVVEYNNAMVGWAQRSNTANSPVVLVDMFTGFDVDAMTREGQHPNEKGDVFMADKFYPVVKDWVIKKSVAKMMRM